MSIFRIAGMVAVALAALLLLNFLLAKAQPSAGLIKSAMTAEVRKRAADCAISKITFIRAGSFVPEAHRKVPGGTAFYPIRVQAIYTATLDDGSREQAHVMKTLYFYKNAAGKWVYEVNSF